MYHTQDAAACDLFTREYWTLFSSNDFFDRGMDPPTLPPLPALPPVANEIASLKRFVIGAGQRGYLPTRELYAQFSKQTVSVLQAYPFPIDIPYDDTEEGL